MADASVQFISQTVDLEVLLRSAGSRNGDAASIVTMGRLVVDIHHA